MPYLRTLLRALLVVMLVARPAAAEPPAAGSSLEGQLLVAEPDMADPRFAGTVVLVLEHGADGALGVVVNRPYGEAPAAEVLERLGLPSTGVTGKLAFHYGGPVQPEVGLVVHGPDYAGRSTRNITAELRVTSDPAILGDLARGKGPRQVRAALGYAGWAPGQLESELARGDWFTLPADPGLVFAPEPARAWREAFARRGTDL